MKHKTLLLCTLLLGSGTTAFAEASPASPAPFICKADAVVKHNNRPAEADRLFRSDTAHLQTADQSATGMDVHQLLPQYA